MDYTALDLSPYYLYEARNNMKDWHRLRQPKLDMGGVDGSGAHFLQAAAESIPQPDASHDVVSAIIHGVNGISFLSLCSFRRLTWVHHLSLFTVAVSCHHFV